jgi:hypothetical protein
MMLDAQLTELQAEDFRPRGRLANAPGTFAYHLQFPSADDR